MLVRDLKVDHYYKWDHSGEYVKLKCVNVVPPNGVTGTWWCNYKGRVVPWHWGAAGSYYELHLQEVSILEGLFEVGI